MRFEQKQRFTKDIQIQIGKPKYRETPMKSKTRHVHGGGSDPRVHGEFVENMRFKKKHRFTKDIQIQIDKPKYRETPIKSTKRHVDGGGRNPRAHGGIRGTNEI